MHEIKTEKYRGFLPLRIMLVVIAAAALVTLVVWQTRIGEKRTELATLQTQIAAQDTRNEEIQKQVEALRNNDGLKEYVEEKARKDLDYAKPGEHIFVDVGGGD